jgi:hypothetical protein
MRGTHRSPSEGLTTKELPLFLITFPRTAKSQEKFLLKASATLQSKWRHLEVKTVFRSAITASNSAMCGPTASNLPTACGGEAVNCTRSAPRKGTHLPPQHAATVGWLKEKTTSPKLSGLKTREGGYAEEEVAEDNQDYNGSGVLFQAHHSRYVLPSGAPRQKRGTAAASDTSGGRSRQDGIQCPCDLTPT